MTDLSIIVITRNNRKILEECLYSIYTYTKAVSFEVIVTDNGSTDGTQALIKEKYENVIFLDNKKNLGFNAANNKGLKIAKGRYVLLLNDDTYISSDAFSDVVKYMDSNGQVGICGPRILNPDGSLQRQGSILSYFRWEASRPVNVPMVIGACLFMRTAMLEDIGLLDENLFFYNDDLDICLRARRSGYRVVYYPSSSVYHYGSFSSRKEPNNALIVEGYRGGLYFCKKHYGITAYHIYRAALLSIVLVILLYYWITSYWNLQKFKLYNDILGIILSQQILPKK